jgi:hypothetical protein
MVAMLVIGITRCGGGGGGDAPAPVELIYSGNTNAAVITLKNATTLVANVLYAGESSTNLPVSISASGETSSYIGVHTQSEILDNISTVIRESVYGDDVANPKAALGIAVNEQLTCDSGTGYVSGTLSDTDGTGTLRFTFNDCLIGGITYNGTGQYIVDSFNFSFLLPDDVRIVFPLMSISGLGFDGSASGAIRYQLSLSMQGGTEKMTSNYVAKDNTTGKMYQYEDYIITTVYDNYYYPTTKSVTYSGSPARVYDSVHGYVDIDTKASLKYSSATSNYPDLDGVLVLTGAAGTSIQVTVLSWESIQLELDTDGISGYEELRILSWSDLAINVETDLTGTDPVNVLHIPLSGNSYSGVGEGSYIGQTFELYEDAFAEKLTVYFDNGVVNFRVLLVEVATSPELHPTTILFESNTISVTEPNTAVSVDFGGISLNSGQTYAWLLDGYVENYGSSMMYINGNVYYNGFLFTGFFSTGTREEHFDGFWYPNTQFDMSLIFEYKRK